jgi:hypothetical protein
MAWVYLLKEKSELSGVFKKIYNMIRNQFGKCIKFFGSDNGGEFVNVVLKEFFVKKEFMKQTMLEHHNRME